MARSLLLELGSLADVTGGQLIGCSKAGIEAVVIDSRQAGPQSLFVALKGDHTDGHYYVADAFARGASAALVTEAVMANMGGQLKSAAERAKAALVVVPDSLIALQSAAAAYLRSFPKLLTVGITGSSGKTTTKELAAAMIAAERRTIMNQGNLNSETGMPLSVFTVRPHHQVAIFELGMNRPNEIAELTAILHPQIALITNIGTAHIGIFGGKPAIAEEKKAIFSTFTGQEVALIPEDDEFQAYLSTGVKGLVRLFGPSQLEEFGGARALGLEASEIRWAGCPTVFALPGAHNVRNALAAAAIAREVGVSDEAIRYGLGAVKPLFGRGEILHGRLTLFRDCYNANPESMEAAISYLDSVETDSRRIYIIGSMLELGDASRVAHQRLGRLLARSKAEVILLFGPEAESSYESLLKARTETQTTGALAAALRAKTIKHFIDFDELHRFVTKTVRPADLVLVKGSRGNELERLTNGLLAGEDF